MYTNTDTKNQTRHMQEMARSFHPERIHFALSFSDWEQALSHGSGLPLDTAQKPCDPSSVLEHIVLTSWHPRNQSVPASWYNVICHWHPRNQSVPASWYTVICHPRNQSVPAFWYNVIWHCHPKNQVWHSQCHLTLSPKESVCSSFLQRGDVNCYHQPWNGSTLTSWTGTVVN